jgi:ABC-type amino acid transport substrate-binding protein
LESENQREARLYAVEKWIGESWQWLLAGLRQGRIDVAKANRAMWAADKLLYRIERVKGADSQYLITRTNLLKVLIASCRPNSLRWVLD